MPMTIGSSVAAPVSPSPFSPPSPLHAASISMAAAAVATTARFLAFDPLMGSSCASLHPLVRPVGCNRLLTVPPRCPDDPARYTPVAATVNRTCSADRLFVAVSCGFVIKSEPYGGHVQPAA